MTISRLWATATAAFLAPRRRAMRRKWAWKYVARVLMLAQATSPMIARSQTLLWFMGAFMRFPALSLLLGQSPAQDARCPAVGKRLISVPISARIDAAAIGLTRGTVCSNAN